MRVKRFQADTLAEAYARVREALGDDALIVSTRQAFAPGLAGFGRREFVEVVAGLPADVDAYMPDRALDDDVAVHDFVRSVAEAAATVVGCGTRSIDYQQACELWGEFWVANALAVNSRSTSPRARKELGWEPAHIDLISDIRDGSYKHRYCVEAE